MIMALLKKIFTVKSTYSRQQELIEDYLASSKSLEEVERRQREIQNGNAPWQKAGYYL